MVTHPHSVCPAGWEERITAMNCSQCQAALPDLLLDPGSKHAIAAQTHLGSCAACEEELSQLQSTFALLDGWPAPEPSPWFDGRLLARLRDEQGSQPESFLERLRSTLLFSTGRQLRPVLAGALALVLAVSGGTALTIAHVLHPASVEASAAVQDLQIIDRNDQALQTMDQLLQDDGTDDGTAAPPAS